MLRLNHNRMPPLADNYFPKYYEVDDVPVKVIYDAAVGELYAENDLGNPWPPIKAMSEGRSISAAEFERLKKARAEEFNRL